MLDWLQVDALGAIVFGSKNNMNHVGYCCSSGNDKRYFDFHFLNANYIGGDSLLQRLLMQSNVAHFYRFFLDTSSMIKILGADQSKLSLNTHQNRRTNELIAGATLL